jgi:hypothetical protein
MKIECEVSLGELVDKITILLIKEKMITDPNKLIHIRAEKNVLENILSQLNLNNIEYHLQGLMDINLKLWKIEDDIRDCERDKKFDDHFIKLARAVYVTNDERFKKKNEINQTFSSKLVEVKSYKEY